MLIFLKFIYNQTYTLILVWYFFVSWTIIWSETFQLNERAHKNITQNDIDARIIYFEFWIWHALRFWFDIFCFVQYFEVNDLNYIIYYYLNERAQKNITEKQIDVRIICFWILNFTSGIHDFLVEHVQMFKIETFVFGNKNYRNKKYCHFQNNADELYLFLISIEIKFKIFICSEDFKANFLSIWVKNMFSVDMSQFDTQLSIWHK